MSIRIKGTIIGTVSMSSILLINNVYWINADYQGNPFHLSIIIISILVMGIMIYYFLNVFTNRINHMSLQLDKMKNHEIIKPSNLPKDEIGSIMKKLEQVSNELYYSEQEIRYHANESIRAARIDYQTGMFNREYFIELLKEQSSNRGALLISIYLVDYLKLNAVKGTTYSLSAIESIAQRLKEYIPSDGLVGRTSTSHFTVYIPLEENLEEYAIQEWALSLEKLLSIPHHLSNTKVFLDYEIGIAYCQPNEERALDDLVQSAELAIMEKLNPLKPKIFQSNNNLLVEQEKQHHMVSHLRQSIENEDFYVMYQPIVNLNEDEISLETLVRWKYEEEWISPTEFIPILERVGLIEELTKLVVKNIVQDYLFWKNQFPNLTHISFNVSPYMFHKKLKDTETFLDFLLQIVKDNNLDPNQICLEITENVLLDKATLNFINECIRNGFLIAVDDFGTGYSSMSYLANYPFDVLKIDRAFVEKLESSEKQQEVANAIVQLAKKLNIKVVAEGVETMEQLMILQKMGADAFQGFFFSKPLFIEQWSSTGFQKKINLLKKSDK